MIDNFLRELFSPDSPATFAQRFEPFDGAPANVPSLDMGAMGPQRPPSMDDLLRQLAPPMPSPREYLRQLPPDPPFDDGSTETLSARSRLPSVPLPQPRPDIENMLAGNRGATSGMPVAPADNDIFAKLAGIFGRGGGGGGNPSTTSTGGDQVSLFGRLAGLSPAADKQFRASLAGGFAGGNPAFAGGALMRGASGALGGGLAQEKSQAKTDKANQDAAQKQANFERAQEDKEKTNEALRKLYGMRGDVMQQNANSRAANAGRTSWNKPASERWKDANRLIIDKEKQLKGSINPLLPKADRDKLEADVSAQLEDFKRKTFEQYGFDQNGKDMAPAMPRQGGAVPSSGKVVGDQEATDKGLYAKGTYDDPAEPASQEEFDALPAGTYFKNPKDGQIMRKRG